MEDPINQFRTYNRPSAFFLVIRRYEPSLLQRPFLCGTRCPDIWHHDFTCPCMMIAWLGRKGHGLIPGIEGFPDGGACMHGSPGFLFRLISFSEETIHYHGGPLMDGMDPYGSHLYLAIASNPSNHLPGNASLIGVMC